MIGKRKIHQAQSLSIRNNILYGFGPANPPWGKKSHVVRNLLTNKNIKTCKQSNTPLNMNASFTLDASGKNMYVWDYNWEIINEKAKFTDTPLIAIIVLKICFIYCF